MQRVVHAKVVVLGSQGIYLFTIKGVKIGFNLCMHECHIY